MARLTVVPPSEPSPADEDPVTFVLSHNLHRRHLTPSQRAAAVVACADWRPRGKPAKPEMVSGLREADMAKVEDLAKAAQVAPRLMQAGDGGDR